jgi:DNA-binding MarR family transcriptional regulator
MRRNGSPVNLPCMCASLRRASRVLTQLYEDEMRPSGLRGTQFTILQALSLAGEVSQGTLGRILAIDSTTLTRTLQIMRRHGWISERRGHDRRERLLSLSKDGQNQYRRALPSWASAQRKLAEQLGDRAWRSLFELTNKIAALESTEGDLS